MNDFDARAATWDDDPTKVERAQAIADAVVREATLSTSMRALEYGCGTGLLGLRLRSSVGDLTLADLSDGMLAVAQEKIAAAHDPHLRAIKLDLMTDPLPEKPYDLVFSAMTLHHIADIEGILRRFHAVLCQRGLLCIADLDAEDGSFHGSGFDGHHGFSREDLETKAHEAGFPDVRFSTPYEIRKEVAGRLRAYPIFLMVARTG
ncbi:MAG: class I SAM-dependent DNA methyltransferase [Casimicrobiaceae bacterium]